MFNSNRPLTSFLLTSSVFLFSVLLAGQTVTVDPSMSHQTLEGWGTSLAWFANGVGGWTNTTNRDSLMNSLFNPTSGLGLTYLRYNIGGGDNPSYSPAISPWYHAVPGFEPSPATFDWNQDANQRWVATTARSYGANLIEAVSYSPPHWMTNSGTSQGGISGADNLAAGYYGSGSGSFADYLTTVVQHFRDSWGITFHHLNPVNEPGQSWWVAGNAKQEGCAFSLSNQESTIQDVASSLSSKGLVATQIAALDEYKEGSLNSASGSTANEFHNYDTTTLNAIHSINSHGYSSALGSVALATNSLHGGKRITMSEWGSNDTTGKDLSNQILADLYLTRTVAWTIWQPDWPELINIDYTNQTYSLNEGYYVYENFTRFIKPGFQLIAISDPSSLAAFNQRTRTLVIVTLNWTASNRSVTYQLSNFTGIGSSAAVYRTSATEHLASLGNTTISSGSFSYTAQANSVTTYVIQNASYTPSATTVNDATTGTGMNQFNYQGTWSYFGAQSGAYNNDNHWSSTTNDFFTFQFTGQQVRVYASMAPNGGIAGFSIDGGPENYFDTYAATRSDNVFLFATPTLSNSSHTLKVRVTGLKNPASTGYNVPADRIDIMTGTSVGQGSYTITNKSTHDNLEVASGSLADGGTVDHTPSNGQTYQRWNVMAVGDGSYRIVNVNSGLDLEVHGASRSNGAAVDQWEDSGSGATNEHWNFVPVGDGSYKIQNVNSGLDLEVNGTTGVIDQWSDVSGAANEHWTLAPSN